MWWWPTSPSWWSLRAFRHPSFTVEPWSVTESALDLDVIAQSESVFALANGHIGMRGNLEEGEPHGLPGTYLDSVYELRPLPYAEAGFCPESGQTIVNVTNGKLIRLLLDDEPFDVRYRQLVSHRRAGARVRVRTTRLVSLVQRAVAAIRYELEAVDRPVEVVVQSELVTNEALPPRPASGERCRLRRTPDGTACSAPNASSSTTSGTAWTSTSTGTPRSSRRCGSPSSTCSRPPSGPRAGRSRQTA